MENLAEILSGLSFGKRVAEQEREALAAYFVETAQWQRIIRGEADIVYGARARGRAPSMRSSSRASLNSPVSASS